MNTQQFKSWLRQKILFCDYLLNFGGQTDYEDTKRYINEARQHAIDLCLPDCAAECVRGKATIRLLACLAALDTPRTVLTPPEIAEQLATAPETVVGWIKSGQLKASNLSTGTRPRYVVTPDDLSSFLKSRQPQPPAKRKRKYNRFSED